MSRHAPHTPPGSASGRPGTPHSAHSSRRRGVRGASGAGSGGSLVSRRERIRAAGWCTGLGSPPVRACVMPSSVAPRANQSPSSGASSAHSACESVSAGAVPGHVGVLGQPVEVRGDGGLAARQVCEVVACARKLFRHGAFAVTRVRHRVRGAVRRAGVVTRVGGSHGIEFPLGLGDLVGETPAGVRST